MFEDKFENSMDRLDMFGKSCTTYWVVVTQFANQYPLAWVADHSRMFPFDVRLDGPFGCKCSVTGRTGESLSVLAMLQTGMSLQMVNILGNVAAIVEAAGIFWGGFYVMFMLHVMSHVSLGFCLELAQLAADFTSIKYFRVFSFHVHIYLDHWSGLEVAVIAENIVLYLKEFWIFFGSFLWVI